MSRRRKALIATGFTYAQWVLSAVTGLFLTRFLIRALGTDVYGMWLATGALLAYAALADLGILGVMPWLIAEADGAKNIQGIRLLLANGLAAGLAGGILYLIIALGVWVTLPHLLHLSALDREALRGPVIAMVVVTAVGYPTRLFAALRLGLQDYTFMGALGVAQTILNLAIVVTFTFAGAGLYGIALGVATPPVVAGVVASTRTMFQTPELLRGWPLPRWSSLRPVVTSGAGQWLGSLGWQLAFASDGAVLAYLGYRSLVPMFVVTSRLGLTLMQLSWVLPDSTAVGIAQLKAEASERSSGVIAALLRLHLFAAGLIACCVLAGNVGFVTAWVGKGLYGGTALNVVFALDVIALSIVHGLMSPVAVLGRRMSVGLLTLLNGAVHIALALLLGRVWGLTGVAIATVISAVLTTIPAGVKMLAEMTSIAVRVVVLRIATPWAVRIVPCAGVATVAGWACARPEVAARLGPHGAVLGSALAGAAVGIAYIVAMRAVMRELPFGPQVRRALLALRLV